MSNRNLIDLTIKILARARRELEYSRRFSKDASASLENLDAGLVDRSRKNGPDDKQIETLQRIVAAYNAAKADQADVADPYKPGGAWKEDMDRLRKPYIDALVAEDIDRLAHLLGDFFRNTGVSGLWTHGYYEKIKSGSKRRRVKYVGDLLEDHRIASDLLGEFDVSRLEIPEVGNPWGYTMKDTLAIPTSFRHFYYCRRFENLLRDTENPIVAEIGGGFGGLAYYLLTEIDGLKYMDFDLPEVLVVVQYFLMNCFPEKSFLLYGEERSDFLDKATLDKYDVALMPNFCLPSVGDQVADLLVNTGSLSEMDYTTVEEYIGQISRMTKGYFFHDNSDKAVANSEHSEVPSSAFPISPDLFSLVYKCQTPWGGQGGRYKEHLYERRSS